MALDFSCRDWADKLVRGETPIADVVTDEAEAERAVGIFNKLRLPDVPGHPEMAEAAGDWIRDIVRALFGSTSLGDAGMARREVGELFLLVPKKNAKTTNAAAIAITFLLMNRRPNADLLIIGPTQKIADLAFEQAKGMIEADADGYLQRRFHIIGGNVKTIRDRTNNARLMVRTFGMDVLTGAKPIFCLIDEVHILGSIPYAADVIRQIRGGMMPFSESALVMITTQSDHPPAGVFKTELHYARAVRDGRISDRVRMLPCLYEFPEKVQTGDGQPWANPEIWAMVSPNLGRSITLTALQDGFARAKEDGPGEVIAWATQHLNVEVGLALHQNRWIGADYWLAATAAQPVTLETIMARCEVAVVGIDGGGADDLLGLFVLGREKDTKTWLGWGHAWAQPIVLDRRKEIAPLLRDFERQGDLTICSHPTQDLVEVAEIAAMLNDARLLPAVAGVGLDPAGVAALVDEMAGAGIGAEQMVAVSQGYRLSSAIWGMERKLMDGTLKHGGQPLMAWSVRNARAEQKGNAVLITKETAGKGKIDPLIAAFNAFMLMARNPAGAAAPSPWEDPNFRMAG